MLGMATDITERKDAEEAMRESDERYRRMVETTTEGISVADSNFFITFVNRQMAEMLGYERGEMLGRSVLDFVFPEDIEQKRRVFERRRAGVRERYDDRFRHKNGSEVWVQIGSTPIFNGSGEFAGALVMISDITERKRAERALRESEARFRNVFRGAGVGMVIVSLDGWFLAVNRTFCEYLGYTEEELIRMTVEEVTQPDDWPLFSAKLEEAIATGTSFQRFEKRCRHKSGCTVYTESGALLIKSPDGKPQYFVGEVLNVTERKMAEQSLADANQRLIDAQEEERAGIARDLHDDISQRLALLAVGIEQLRQGSAESSAELGELLRQTDEISADIQSIAHQLHPSKLEYLGIVSAIKSFCKESEEKQKIDIHFSNENIPATVPREVSICLFRVLQEALRNGIKHSGVRHFRVCLQGTPCGISLRVSDSGVGFDAEDKKGPLGLGLISMRERVHLVKGTLSIGTTPGGGTTIDAFVPIADAKAFNTPAI
jgi:PAS domain S-box-containing protein